MTPRHNTFSLFITHADPEAVECLFAELRDQALAMDIVDDDEAVKVSLDSTFMKAYSKRGRKGGKSEGVPGWARRIGGTTSSAGGPTPQCRCQPTR